MDRKKISLVLTHSMLSLLNGGTALAEDSAERTISADSVKVDGIFTVNVTLTPGFSPFALSPSSEGGESDGGLASGDQVDSSASGKNPDESIGDSDDLIQETNSFPRREY
jgi:hypothetical protein